MTEGLEIDENAFSRMSAKQRDLILFRNTNETIRILGGYKVQQKAQWGILSLIGGGLLWTMNALYQHIGVK